MCTPFISTKHFKWSVALFQSILGVQPSLFSPSFPFPPLPCTAKFHQSQNFGYHIYRVSWKSVHKFLSNLTQTNKQALWKHFLLCRMRINRRTLSYAMRRVTSPREISFLEAAKREVMWNPHFYTEIILQWHIDNVVLTSNYCRYISSWSAVTIHRAEVRGQVSAGRAVQKPLYHCGIGICLYRRASITAAHHWYNLYLTYTPTVIRVSTDFNSILKVLLSP